ncbi:MAG: hypothetical protein EOO61_01120 [Hymenobacter sp.]|nr:MAG: hypothetical protein EOO61_01120 [Hymenobacter sp.]
MTAGKLSLLVNGRKQVRCVAGKSTTSVGSTGYLVITIATISQLGKDLGWPIELLLKGSRSALIGKDSAGGSRAKGNRPRHFLLILCLLPLA